MEDKLIYKAIIGVMEDIGAVSKEKDYRSNQGSYKYRGVDDVMNALHPAMVKHKIFMAPTILEQIREVRTSKSGTSMYVSICTIRYDFYTVDGSSISVTIIGEGMDTGDKSTNKAMSVAFKYACFQIFCIPTEEMIDPDGERPEVEVEEAEAKIKSNEKSKASRARQRKPAEKEQQKNPVNETKVTADMVSVIEENIKKYNLKPEKILAMYKVSNIADMTMKNYEDCMNKLKLYEKQG